MSKRTQIVVIGIVRRGNTYLLTKRVDKKNNHSQFHDKWQFPGGGLEFGESTETALLRELKEEIGVDVNITRLVPKIFHTVRNNVWQGVFIAYLCTMKNESDKIVLDDEASEYAWLTLEQVGSHDTIHLTKELLSCVA